MTTATATTLIDTFATGSGAGVWPNLNRAALASQLKARLAAPNSVNQAGTPLCGPASFIRALIIDKPDAYAQAAIDLFTKGQATIGTLTIKPGAAVLAAAPASGMPQADWLMLSALRDSSNWVVSTSDSVSPNSITKNTRGYFSGITIPEELVSWFKNAGFRNVYQKVDPSGTPTDTAFQIRDASTYQAAGYHVVMLIDSDVMLPSNQDDLFSMYPDHWVTLTTPIKDGGLLADSDPISMQVFSWGQIWPIPQIPTKTLMKKYFINKFYGYVAAMS